MGREGLPALTRVAREQERPVPAAAPRILLELTEEPRPDDQRACGQGTPEQVRADLEELAALGATHVLLDTHLGPEPATREDHERHWRTLERVADLAADLVTP